MRLDSTTFLLNKYPQDSDVAAKGNRSGLTGMKQWAEKPTMNKNFSVSELLTVLPETFMRLQIDLNLMSFAFSLLV